MRMICVYLMCQYSIIISAIVCARRLDFDSQSLETCASDPSLLGFHTGEMDQAYAQFSHDALSTFSRWMDILQQVMAFKTPSAK